MSTLGHALALHERDREMVYIRKPFRISETWEPASMVNDYAARYRLMAVFETRVVIKDADRHNYAHSEAAGRAKCQIVDGVFGEYYRPLLEAVREIDNYEPEKARDIILKVLANMRGFEPMNEERA